jgi:hypothetical protein
MINGLGNSLGWFVTAASKQLAGRATTNVSAVFGAVLCYAVGICAVYMISERGKAYLHSSTGQQNLTSTPPSSPSSSPTHSPMNLFKGVFALDGISPTVPRRVITPRLPTE